MVAALAGLKGILKVSTWDYMMATNSVHKKEKWKVIQVVVELAFLMGILRA